MNVSRLKVGGRIRVEARLGRDAQVGPERDGAIAGLIDAEPGRGTRPHGYPRHIDGEPPEDIQIEVLADLRHQADAVQEGGGGKGHGEAGSADVADAAVYRPVGGEADVADDNQISRALFPVPHVTGGLSASRGRRASVCC